MAQLRLDRKSLLVLAAGALIVVVLVFLAGYLVGLNSALAEQVEPAEPPPKQEALTGSAEEEVVPNVPIRPSETAAEPAPEPYSDEPVPLDDSEPAPEVAEQEGEPAETGDFTIQLGAFREQEHARSLERELLDMGLEPEVTRLDDPVLGALFKVRVGRYANFDEAREVARQVQAQAGRDAWPVRMN